MPSCPTLHSYLKTQAKQGIQGVLADDPDAHYLLGFETDKVQSLPVKTYIRRLWLAFQSSEKPSMPRYFFDAEAERFAKEIESWVSDFVKDEDRLAFEIAKDPIVLDEKTKETRSAFLEDTARTILVTREWGDHLWGSRTFCTSPLANAKRELGDDEPPEWPWDQGLITTTVRHWLAARLQDKLQNPRQAKNVPRVECPENPDQKGLSIAAVFPYTTLYGSEEVADLVIQEPGDVTEEATQLQRHEVPPPHRKSTRRRKPSARAIDVKGLQSTCADYTITLFQPVPQAGQRESVQTEATEVSSLSHPKPPVALSQSSGQCSDNVKLNIAVPRVAPIPPSPLERKRGVKYVKPSRTALKARMKPTRLLPTPASSIVVSQSSSKGLHGSPIGLKSAPIQDLIGLHTSHNGGNISGQLTPSNKHKVSRNRFHPDRDSHTSGIIQHHAGFFAPPQDHYGQSIDLDINPLRDWNEEGSWETYRSHSRRALPCHSACERDKGADPFTGKDNAITVQNSTSRDMFELMKCDEPKSFISSQGQSAAPKRVSEVPQPNEAVHSRRYNHESEPKAEQWKDYASDREHDRISGAAMQRVDDLDIDFVLLGDPSADDLYGDLF